MFVSEDRWEAGLGKAMAASIIPMLHSPKMKAAVSDYVSYEGVGKYQDHARANLNRFKVERQTIEKYKVGCKEEGCKGTSYKVADNGDACRGDKCLKSQGHTVGTAPQTTAKVSVDECCTTKACPGRCITLT